MKKLRVFAGERVECRTPELPTCALSFVFAREPAGISLRASVSVDDQVVDTWFVNFLTHQIEHKGEPMSEKKESKAPWMTEREVCVMTGLMAHDVYRLAHQLERRADEGGFLYSRSSVERLMKLYRLPHKRFFPIPPDLSGEERWIGGNYQTQEKTGQDDDECADDASDVKPEIEDE